MTRAAAASSLVLMALAATACRKDGPASPTPQPATADAAPTAGDGLPAVPAGLPARQSPADNPTTAAKAELGYVMFFDPRLSKDDSMACAGCHQPATAYAVPEALSAKVGGARNTRNAPTMLNLGYHREFYWDGRMPTLEACSAAAWKGQLGADPAAVAAKLAAVPGYAERFQKAFGAGPTAENIPQAFAAFFRTLQSGNSAYDRFAAGDNKALNAQQQNGFKLFTQAGCVSCHTPPMFTNYAFHNVGIGTDKPEAERDNGRANHTKADGDKGRFKTPTLRDVGKTGPYFHDGSAATLKDAIRIMAGGGLPNPGLDPLLQDRKLSDGDIADIEAFLGALEGTPTYPAAPSALP